MNYMKTSEMLHAYSALRPECEFSTMDLSVLHIVMKYHKLHKPMSLTNNEMADVLFASEKTVRNSINHLCAAGIIEKHKIGNRRYVEFVPFGIYT